MSPCSDGDPCTTGDTCNNGQCAPGEYTCGECVVTADCKPKEDGDVCNGTLTCDKLSHTCLVDPTTVITCAQPVGGAAGCVEAVCDAKTGKCGLVPAGEGLGCDDANACTTLDACKKGVCAGQYGAVACDDGNPCTQDVCDPGAGCKTLSLDGVLCTDGDLCSQGDLCAGGKCSAGPPLGCDDGNPCTTDGCHPTQGCVHNVNTLPCNDGNVCTTGDTCLGAVCTPKAALDCDDSNVCTADACDPKLGCQYDTALGIQCNDGNACTAADKCTGGQCLGGGQLPCSDGNVCTDDGCDAKSGCTFLANLVGCNDGNACTENDGCQGGGCKSGKPLDCNDANTCTVDLCDPAKGCAYQNVANATPCNDGDACTVSDTCSGGICLAGSKLQCNDNEVCTTDTCEPKSGCVYTPHPDAEPCDDKSACTPLDACAKGKCTGTGTKDVDQDGHIDASCPQGDDCNDASDKAHPGLTEVCDDLDNDCKAGVDDGCDDDNDDWCDSAMVIPAGVVPKTCSKGGGDCDDAGGSVNPGATEKLEVAIEDRVSGLNGLATEPQALALGPGGDVHVLARGNVASGGSRLYVWSRTPGASTWTLGPVGQNVDSQQFEGAMALDASGQVHVAHTRPGSSGGYDLCFAVRGANGWKQEVVLAGSDERSATLPSMWIGPGVNPLVYIAFYDSNQRDLMLARRTSGTWSVTALDTEGDVGKHASLGVDAAGAVWIAYLDTTQQDLKVATDSGSPNAFTLTKVDGAASAAGFFASMALDGAGKAHVAYYELIGSDLRYATNASGTWVTETVDAPGTVGKDTHVAVEPGGKVHIIYRDVDTGTLKLASGQLGQWALTSHGEYGSSPIALIATEAGPMFARQQSDQLRLETWTSGGQMTVVPVNANWGGVSSTSFLAATSRPIGDGDLVSMRWGSSGLGLARWTGTGLVYGSWPLGEQKASISPADVVLGSTGTAHVCGSVAGSQPGQSGMAYGFIGWEGIQVTQPLDPSGKSDGSCALAIGPTGTAHIAWYEPTNGILRYATLTAGVQSGVEVPDPTPGTGFRQAMRVRPDGTVVIVYPGYGLRTASRSGTSGAWSIETVFPDEVPADFAQVVDGAGLEHLYFSLGPKIMRTSRQGEAWSTPEEIADGLNGTHSVSYLSVGIDASGNTHIAASVRRAVFHLTNAFGGWSRFQVGSSSPLTVPTGVSMVDTGQVLVSWMSNNYDLTTVFSYQNLVDDNCDGK